MPPRAAEWRLYMPVKTNAKIKRVAAAKEYKREQESTSFNNTLWVFCAVIVLEAFMIIGYEQCVKTGYYSLWFQYVLVFGRLLFPLLAAASAVRAVLRRRKRENAMFFVRSAVLCAALGAVCFLAWAGTGETAKALCVGIPITGLLLFVLFTYQLEFSSKA